MKPKEKAKELFDKYKNLSEKCDCLEYSCICFHMGDYKAKECTLIAVDELIEAFKELSIQESGRVYIDFGHGYWEDVKAEIEKL